MSLKESLSLFDPLNFTPDLKPSYGLRLSRRRFGGRSRIGRRRLPHGSSRLVSTDTTLL